MKLHEWQRERRAADLALHGWVPVVLVGSAGIYNTDVEVGLVVGTGPSPSDPLGQRVDQVMRLTREAFLPQFVGTWDDVADDILDKIDARLREV